MNSLKNNCFFIFLRFWQCILAPLFFYQSLQAEIPISSLADHGPGTLRDAILNAQNGDILLFDSNLSGTIMLQSALPNVAVDLHIVGPTNNLVSIEGSSVYSIFNIADGFPSIANLQLSNGSNASGGVLALQPDTSVTLSNILVSHSSEAFNHRIFADAGSTIYSHNLNFSNPNPTAHKHIFFNAGSSIVLDSDNTIQAQMVIDGSVSLIKKNNGSIAVYTLSAIDGSLNVDQGVLIFNGSTIDPINVNANGMLKGNCSCFYLVNGGTVRPGNSIGTITLSGDYIQTGSLVIELASGASSLLQVGGNAFLDGALVFDPQGVLFKGDTFTFLDVSGTITGSFSSVSSTTGGVNFALQYFPNSIQAVVLKNSIANGAQFTGNTQKVLSLLENASIDRNSDIASVLSAINALGSSSSMESALNQLDPDLFLSIVWSDATTLYHLNEIVASQQLSYCDGPCRRISQPTHCKPSVRQQQPEKRRWSLDSSTKKSESPKPSQADQQACCCTSVNPNRLWMSVLGERTRQHTVDDLIGFRTYSEGVIIGYDRTFNLPLTLGACGIFTHSNLVWKDNSHRGNTKINGYYGNVYGSYCWKHVILDTSLTASAYQNSIERKIDFTGIHRVAKSSPNSSSLMGHFGVTTVFPVHKLHFSPFVLFDYISIWQNSFREHGAKSLDLRVHSIRTGFIHAEAGLFLNREFCRSWGTIVPSVSLSWVYLGPTAGTHIRGELISLHETLTNSTSNHGFNAISPMVALGFTIGNNWWISANYKGEFGDRRNVQDANLNVRWQF